MSLDYSEEDDYNGFSDHEEAQIYLNDDISEDHGHFYDEEASEGATDSDDESKDHSGFVDDEASEAESDLESPQSYRQNTAIFPDTLQSFMRLPIELREMIWKQFCPDLSKSPRVLEVIFWRGRRPTFAPQVEDQTEPLRRILAVHQESRRLGHKFAPHLIQLYNNHGVAPCHMERDILLVDWKTDHRVCPGEDEVDMLAEIAPGLQNLAIPVGVTFFDDGPDLDRLYSLKNVFVTQDSEMIPTIGLTWCLSDKAQSYHVVHPEEVYNGLTEELNLLFFWPDVEKHGESGERSFSPRSFASLQFDEEGFLVNEKGERRAVRPSQALSISDWGYEIARLREFLDPVHEMNTRSARHSRSGSSEPDSWLENGPKDGQETEEQSSLPRPHRVSVWPLARFEFDDGLRRLEAMKAWDKPWEEWETDCLESDRDEEDDLDSLEGFIASDDPPDSEIDDDEDDLSDLGIATGAPDDSAQYQNLDLESADEDESATEPGDSSRGLHDNEAAIDLVDSSEREEDGEDGEDVITGSRGVGSLGRRVRGRHIPLDSEDENDDEDDALPQPTRTGRRRAAIPSSESEDDEKEEDNGQNHTGKLSIEDEEESSSEQDEDGSEEEMPPPPSMSLAQRLRLEAAQARAAFAADDSDDEEQEQDQDVGASDDEEDALDGEEMGMGLADEDEEDDDEEGW